jgi:hypothetical protein
MVSSAERADAAAGDVLQRARNRGIAHDRSDMQERHDWRRARLSIPVGREHGLALITGIGGLRILTGPPPVAAQPTP